MEDAALLFGRMAGYAYMRLQKRRRGVEGNLSLQKSEVSRVLSVEQGRLCSMCLFTCEEVECTQLSRL